MQMQPLYEHRELLLTNRDGLMNYDTDHPGHVGCLIYGIIALAGSRHTHPCLLHKRASLLLVPQRALWLVRLH